MKKSPGTHFVTKKARTCTLQWHMTVKARCAQNAILDRSSLDHPAAPLRLAKSLKTLREILLGDTLVLYFYSFTPLDQSNVHVTPLDG